MTVELEPTIQQYIEDQIKAGHFSSVKEVLEAGVARLMLDPPDVLDEEDIAVINESLAQMRRGEVVTWDELSKRLRAEYLGE